VGFSKSKNGFFVLTTNSLIQSYYLRKDRATCLVLWFLGLAFLDNAFEEYASPAELFQRKNPTTRELLIRFKNDVSDVPILRTAFSPTEPWYFQSANHLGKKIVHDAGFPQRFTFYNIRRGIANTLADCKKTFVVSSICNKF
jgi:hypothetical protein